MPCSLKSIRYDTFRYVTKIENDNAKYVYMPTNSFDDPPAWDYIRFLITSPQHGARIAEAYKEAGYSGIVPPDDIKQCIKDIYTYKPFAGRDKPYGDWVFDMACQCLNMTTPDGRMNIGDGFVVPNISEQSCIYQSLEEGKTLSLALFECCPDIIPPLESLKEIEDKLRLTVQPFYAVWDRAHTVYVGLHGSTNEIGYQRLFIGDGFTVPSLDEYSSLADAIYNKKWSLAYAYSVICPDIIPPLEAIPCIEKHFSTSTLMTISIASLTDTYRQCHDELTKKKTNWITYGLIGVLAVALIAGRD